MASKVQLPSTTTFLTASLNQEPLLEAALIEGE